MKKIFLPVFLIISLCLFNTTLVFAKEKPFFKSKAGVELTEENYQYLKQYISENTIDTLPQSEIDILLNEKLENVTEAKYFVDLSVVDNHGKVISTLTKEITKEEYNQEPEIVMPLATDRDATLETNMKIIYLRVSRAYDGKPRAFVDLSCNWKDVPIVKSFDVIGVRWDTDKYKVEFYNGTQQAFGTNYKVLSQTYTFGGKNAILKTYGMGISMNIFDDTKDALSTSIFVRGDVDAAMTVTGTYQHATSAVTLAQSQDYNFSQNGLGQVFDFKSSTIKKRYDNTPGITITLPYK